MLSSIGAIQGCCIMASAVEQGYRSNASGPSLQGYGNTSTDVLVKSLRPPHSGYHFDGSGRHFMEGWYFKLSLPEEKESFAWMYAVEDPGHLKSKDPSSHPSVGAQVLGPQGEYLWQDKNSVQTFWASPHDLALRDTFLSKQGEISAASLMSSEEFWTRVEEGFQATTTIHQGSLRDDKSSSNLKTVEKIRWEYITKPVYGWGNVGSPQKSTAGWLASFPVFEPHWQICMAGGLSTGWIEWGSKSYEFVDAPSYVEKNWGGKFPEKWFWVQCNVFKGASGDIALTAGGGRREIPFWLGSYEDVALIGVHYKGNFYEFVPWLGEVSWEIAPWGSWKMSAKTSQYKVTLEATTDSPGTRLRAPTMDGMVPLCTDTFDGVLNLKLWENTEGGGKSKLILDVSSDMGALETGGGPWETTWKASSRMTEPKKTLVGLPLNLEKLFTYIPMLKPPGF